MPKHVCIVEDEQDIANNYTDALRRHGYSVSHYLNRKQALTAFGVKLPDLAIIDIGLGDDVDGGFELCRELRSRSPQLPIIFLTARDDEFDVVSGLRLGADDYLTKDISLPHMMARITALFRRLEVMQGANKEEKAYERGPLSLSLDRMTASWNGANIDLTVTEFWIVHALSAHPGHVKNRTQLMEAANVVLDDNTITSHIKRIRKKFKVIDAQFDSIHTAYGMGYRWVNAE